MESYCSYCSITFIQECKDIIYCLISAFINILWVQCLYEHLNLYHLVLSASHRQQESEPVSDE